MTKGAVLFICISLFAQATELEDAADQTCTQARKLNGACQELEVSFEHLIIRGLQWKTEWKANPKNMIENRPGEYVGQRNAQGNKHGFGGITQVDGDWFFGEWRQDMRHGLGKILTGHSSRSIEETYTGGWRYDSQHGIGNYTSQNRDNYCGEWVVGVQDGLGVYKYSDGSFYCGQWRNGSNHGLGVFVDSKLTYHGFWVNGEREGPATLRNTETNKLLFDGMFRNNEPMTGTNTQHKNPKKKQLSYFQQ